MGINRDQETQGQASFCTLLGDGSVNEVTVSFNYINQYKVIEGKYFLLNFIEVLRLPGENGQENATFFNTIAVYRDDGSILRILVEEKLKTKRELVCDIDNDMMLIYYKDDGSIVKKLSIADILLTHDEN